jgi:hypothetical protein
MYGSPKLSWTLLKPLAGPDFGKWYAIDQTALCSFDLEDCDKVFRLETKKVNYQFVFQVFHNYGFECMVMNT